MNMALQTDAQTAGIGNGQNEDRWSKVFREHGEVWGKGPSPSGKILIEQVKQMRDRLYQAGTRNPTINVVEAGYGYGRDAIPFLQIKHTKIAYTGVDPSPVGQYLASQSLHNVRSPGRAFFIAGDFTSKDLPLNDEADFVFSHRVMHLLGSNGKVRDFLRNAHGILKPGGEAIIAVRDERDFKPDRMEYNKDGDAYYKDRPDHVMTLWGTNDLITVFRRAGFEIEEIIKGSEQESTLHPDEITNFTIIRAKKPEANPAPSA